MKINGEGIYGSKAWRVFAEGEMVKDQKNPKAQEKLKGMPGGKLDKIHADFSFSTKDFRFTQGKDGSVYAFCMTVPKPGEQIRIVNLGSTNGSVNTVSLLGSGETITWKQEKEALIIDCPDKMEYRYSVCFKIK
jgi:alpha-L-fucosidase